MQGGEWHRYALYNTHLVGQEGHWVRSNSGSRRGIPECVHFLRLPGVAVLVAGVGSSVSHGLGVAAVVGHTLIWKESQLQYMQELERLNRQQGNLPKGLGVLRWRLKSAGGRAKTSSATLNRSDTKEGGNGRLMPMQTGRMRSRAAATTSGVAMGAKELTMKVTSLWMGECSPSLHQKETRQTNQLASRAKLPCNLLPTPSCAGTAQHCLNWLPVPSP